MPRPDPLSLPDDHYPSGEFIIFAAHPQKPTTSSLLIGEFVMRPGFLRGGLVSVGAITPIVLPPERHSHFPEAIFLHVRTKLDVEGGWR